MTHLVPYCTVLLQYGAELAVYFSTVGIELVKHVVPRRLDDLEGLMAPAVVEQRLAPGTGVVRACVCGGGGLWGRPCGGEGGGGASRLWGHLIGRKCPIRHLL